MSAQGSNSSIGGGQHQHNKSRADEERWGHDGYEQVIREQNLSQSSKGSGVLDMSVGSTGNNSYNNHGY